MSTVYELVACDTHGAEQARYPITSLPFRPGDVIVIQIPRSVSRAALDDLRRALLPLFPPERVLIVTEDVRFLRLEAKSHDDD
jgi:hypothetical protein